MSQLYHYTRLETFAEKIMPSLQLKMNNPDQVNDPVESKLLYRLDDAKYKKLGVLPRVHLIRQRNKHNIVCFCTDKTYRSSPVPGWALPKMWTHYANDHKGVCLIINKQKFLKQNEEIIKFGGFVKYKLKFNLPTLCANKLVNGDYNTYIDEVINENYNEFFFQKNYDWRSESEFRVVSFEKDICSISESIEGIIYGLKTPLYNIIGLSHLMKSKEYVGDTDVLFPSIKEYKIYISGSRLTLKPYLKDIAIQS